MSQNSLRRRTLEEIRQISIQDPDLGPLLQSKEAGKSQKWMSLLARGCESPGSDGKDSHL